MILHSNSIVLVYVRSRVWDRPDYLHRGSTKIGSASHKGGLIILLDYKLQRGSSLAAPFRFGIAFRSY